MVTQKLYKNKEKNAKKKKIIKIEKKYSIHEINYQRNQEKFSFASFALSSVKRCVTRSNDWDFRRCLYCHENVKKTV